MFDSTSIKSRGPTVLIPIDIPIRELDSKLVLAAVLAGRGFTSIIGHKREMHHVASRSGPVVWQGKELFSGDIKSVKNTIADRLIENGSAIVYVQDEGGMYQVRSWRDQVIEKHQLDAMRKRKVDRVCTWGRKQRDVIADYAPELSDTLRVTGSARFDICQRRFDWIDAAAVRGINQRFGDYLLVCTRFGSVANTVGMQQWFRQKVNTLKKEVDARTAEIWFDKWYRDIHDLGDFILFVRELAAAHPKRQIVLRPHPSENISFYSELFAQSGNVEVIREGNVLDWIRGARLVVHSNCTTGIEAVVAGKPVLNYLPGGEERPARDDVEVARDAGTIARSLSQALAAVDALLSDGAMESVWSPHALSILNNLETDAIPLLVDEAVAAAQEKKIDSTSIELPAAGRLREFWRERVRGQADPSQRVASRRDPITADRVELMLEGCQTMGIGSGRVRLLRPQYAVIDPL